jgi:hypothetical protein
MKSHTAHAGSRPECHSCHANFSCMHNARVVKLQQLPMKFQRKAWEFRKWTIRSESVAVGLERQCVTVGMKPTLQWCLQKGRGAGNMNYSTSPFLCWVFSRWGLMNYFLMLASK